MARLQDRLGVIVQNTWGMTELSPVGTVASIHTPKRQPERSGRPAVGVDLMVADDQGAPLLRQRGEPRITNAPMRLKALWLGDLEPETVILDAEEGRLLGIRAGIGDVTQMPNVEPLGSAIEARSSFGMDGLLPPLKIRLRSNGVPSIEIFWGNFRCFVQ